MHLLAPIFQKKIRLAADFLTCNVEVFAVY